MSVGIKISNCNFDAFEFLEAQRNVVGRLTNSGNRVPQFLHESDDAFNVNSTVSCFFSNDARLIIVSPTKYGSY